MHPSVELELRYGAHNYEPLPVTLVRGEGVYVWDEEGKRYIDMMSAYSAVSFGHCHPKIVQALRDQAGKLGVISRAYYSDNLGSFLQQACELTGQDKALPMNSGAEAVETALKAARKWAYTVKGIRPNKAEIISCENNFHGRTIAIISMSSEPQYQAGFGPFLPGLRTIHYGKIQELEMAITHNTAAFIVEPIQGEGGIIVPPPGYLKACAEICKKNKVLFLCDEIQTGLGRTGKMLACDHEGVRPDGVMLGKALGGGMLPVSLFLARKEVMNVFQPGDHGSTFGGNPLSMAVASAALQILIDENLISHAAEMGDYFMNALRSITSPVIKSVRGKGLLIGVEVQPDFSARDVCLKLLKYGILSKDTHKTVVRLAPPLVITREQIDETVKLIKQALDEIKPEEPEATDVEVTLPPREEEFAVEAAPKVRKKRAPRPKPVAAAEEVKAEEVAEALVSTEANSTETTAAAEPEVVEEETKAAETEAQAETTVSPAEATVAAEPEAVEVETKAAEAEAQSETTASPVEATAAAELEPVAEETKAAEAQAQAETAASPVEATAAAEPEPVAEETKAAEAQAQSETAASPIEAAPAAAETQADQAPLTQEEVNLEALGVESAAEAVAQITPRESTEKEVEQSAEMSQGKEEQKEEEKKAE